MSLTCPGQAWQGIGVFLLPFTLILHQHFQPALGASHTFQGHTEVFPSPLQTPNPAPAVIKNSSTWCRPKYAIPVPKWTLHRYLKTCRDSTLKENYNIIWRTILKHSREHLKFQRTLKLAKTFVFLTIICLWKPWENFFYFKLNE